jgi:hypothetical protein
LKYFASVSSSNHLPHNVWILFNILIFIILCFANTLFTRFFSLANIQTTLLVAALKNIYLLKQACFFSLNIMFIFSRSIFFNLNHLVSLWMLFSFRNERTKNYEWTYTWKDENKGKVWQMIAATLYILAYIFKQL